MILKDSRGNEFVEMIDVEENVAMAEYAPVTHCLAVVMVGSDYLLGWNKWRKDWEIFGGCIETGSPCGNASQGNVWKKSEYQM